MKTKVKALPKTAPPFFILIVPTDDLNGYRIDTSADPELEEQVDRIAAFIGDMLVNYPMRPSR